MGALAEGQGNPAPRPALQIRRPDLQAMEAGVARAAPEEACGLLAGRAASGVYTVEWVIPTTNILHSPVRYRIDPHEQLRAFERIDAAGLELVGIYHSHPFGPPGPSPTDLTEAYYPEAVYLIWSAAGGAWECRAFRLLEGQAQPVDLYVVS